MPLEHALAASATPVTAIKPLPNEVRIVSLLYR